MRRTFSDESFFGLEGAIRTKKVRFLNMFCLLIIFGCLIQDDHCLVYFPGLNDDDHDIGFEFLLPVKPAEGDTVTNL